MARQNIPDSGLWSNIAAIFNAMFADVYTRRSYGVYNYDDSGTTISIAAPDTWYNLTNDGAGAQTLKFPVNGITEFYDTTTQSFDFSGLNNGDSVDIRLDVIVTSTTANQDFDISLFLADDTGTPIEVPFIVEQAFKTAGSRRVIRFNSTFIGADLTRTNEARFKIKSSAAGSVEINGWYVRAWPAKIEA